MLKHLLMSAHVLACAHLCLFGGVVGRIEGGWCVIYNSESFTG